jgi:hypothetical protein
MPGRRRNLELCLPSDQIDARGKRAVRALVRDLRREINSDAERNAQDIEEPEERMAPQVTQHMPSKNAEVLVVHVEDSLH